MGWCVLVIWYVDATSYILACVLEKTEREVWPTLLCDPCAQYSAVEANGSIQVRCRNVDPHDAIAHEYLLKGAVNLAGAYGQDGYATGEDGSVPRIDAGATSASLCGPTFEVTRGGGGLLDRRWPSR